MRLDELPSNARDRSICSEITSIVSDDKTVGTSDIFSNNLAIVSALKFKPIRLLIFSTRMLC